MVGLKRKPQGTQLVRPLILRHTHFFKRALPYFLLTSEVSLDGMLYVRFKIFCLQAGSFESSGTGEIAVDSSVGTLE